MGRWADWSRSSGSAMTCAFLCSALGCQAKQIDSGEVLLSSTTPVVSVRGGEALVAWHRTGARIFVSSALEGSTAWTTPTMIASGNYPEVAMSTSGAGFVVYAGPFVGVGAASRPGPTLAKVRTGGVWSAPVTLDSSGGSGWFRSIAADAAGNALAVWANAGIRASVYQSGVGWQPVTTLNPSGGTTPKVAMTEAGAGVAGWCDGGRIFAASYEPATGWGAPFSTARTDCCTRGGFISSGINVAISESGDAYAVGANATVCVVSRPAGSSWSWSTLGGEALAESAQVAATPDGHVLAAWIYRSGGASVLKAQAYTPGTGWGPLLTGPSHLRAQEPIGIGYGSGGYAAIMFKPEQSIERGLRYVIYDAAAGTLGTPLTFTAAHASPFYLRTAANPLEPAQGVTVWQQTSGPATLEDIWGARIGI